VHAHVAGYGRRSRWPAGPSEVGWSRGPRRRYAGATSADTTSASRAQKVEDGTSSLFPASTPRYGETARSRGSTPFRATIGDRQAVYWWLLGHELSFQAKSLGPSFFLAWWWSFFAPPRGGTAAALTARRRRKRRASTRRRRVGRRRRMIFSNFLWVRWRGASASSEVPLRR
jgi:hypothetical protein